MIYFIRHFSNVLFSLKTHEVIIIIIKNEIITLNLKKNHHIYLNMYVKDNDIIYLVNLQ